MDDRLIEVMRRHDNICPYIDIPMQHISQPILDAMNRAETGVHIREICRKLRENGIAIRTTLMVGFPGETEADFEELMDFVREMKFDRMGAFIFSPEEGTAAEQMDNPVPPETAQERYDRLMTLQQSISAENNRRRVGNEYTVLVEKRQGRHMIGRSMLEAPEIDGKIIFTAKEPLQEGQFVRVRIVDAREYDLIGEQV